MAALIWAVLDDLIQRRINQRQSHLIHWILSDNSREIHVSNLCGGTVVAICDLHSQVVVRVPRSIKPAGNGNGSCVSLDVKVLFFITS